ncbi:MAG: hypothetical protein H6729_09965 [Deltaproteobacteria bacterium]|nr:hypothetical protein [Deltaproteobacteria bacterium]
MVDGVRVNIHGSSGLGLLGALGLGMGLLLACDPSSGSGLLPDVETSLADGDGHEDGSLGETTDGSIGDVHLDPGDAGDGGTPDVDARGDAGADGSIEPSDGGSDGSITVADAAFDAGEDAGPADVGACDCTYGFYPQCAADEVCIGNWTGRADAGAVSCTPRVSGSTPLTAQCAPPNLPGCFRLSSESVLSAWATAYHERLISNEACIPHSPDPATSCHLHFRDALGTTAANPICGELIRWSLLATIRLCGGDDAVQSPEDALSWEDIEFWTFAYVPSSDTCRDGSINRCVSDVGYSLQFQQVLTTWTERVHEVCADDELPFGSPCGGLPPEDAKACVVERLRTLISVLLQKSS